MRPINSSSSPSGISIWKSPIPYLFGGLALLLILISVALVILFCSYKKHASQLSTEGEDIKLQVMPKNIEIESEPKILVTMAGDDKPTYLAKPITSSTHCTCEVESTTPSSSSCK
ncbi:protein GLUTAMINE DUMPER 6-like [Gastrolobium bilobum]|uniref:protein GLUTAMINE DUMPER 6-like n=1 Tax=Gastrolobium bilobum TaxID=150636 RepID=UPI002AB13929|nr:protein GLUTAMINE DUMPER 6-like [Gastrolobium bilobum]